MFETIHRRAMRWTMTDGQFLEEIASLGSDDANARRLAAGQLWELDCATLKDIAARIGGPLIPEIVRIIKKQALDGDDRELPLILLGSTGPEALPAILELVNDPDDPVREDALDALTRVGPEAESAIPMLARVFREEPYLAPSAARALAAIADRCHKTPQGVVAAMSPLRDALKEDDRTLRDIVVHAMEFMLNKEGPALLALRNALNEHFERSRLRVSRGLTPYPDKKSRYDIDPYGPPELARIRRWLAKDFDLGNDAECRCRLDAARNLWRFGRDAEAAIPLLVNILSRNKRTRQDVINVFSELGSAASAALPALNEIRMEAKGDLRDAVVAAIEAIQPHVGRTPQDRGAALPGAD
jgi:hypothetical protein